MENIKKWLNDNNIIFGLDEDDTAIYDVKPRDFHKNNAETSCSAGAGDTGNAHQEHFVTDYRNSLKAGLDRMLIGSLMPVTSGDDISHDYNIGNYLSLAKAILFKISFAIAAHLSFEFT